VVGVACTLLELGLVRCLKLKEEKSPTDIHLWGFFYLITFSSEVGPDLSCTLGQQQQDQPLNTSFQSWLLQLQDMLEAQLAV